MMEQEKREIEVCNRSLNLARQHKISGNCVRAFAHYLVHKSILWELNEQDKMSQDIASISEISATFEKVKDYFDTKLKTNDEEILTQWRSTNEQYLELLVKTIGELTNKQEAYHTANEDYDYVSDILIEQTTEYAMSLFRIGQYLNACEVYDSFLCNSVMFQNPKVGTLNTYIKLKCENRPK